MSHDRWTIAAEKIKLAICFSIKMCIWTKFLHPGNFTEILRKVRLHRQMILLLNLRKFLHQLIRTGRSKSRSKDRFYIFKFCKCILKPFNSCICRSLQFRRTIPVHIYFTDHGLHSCFIKLFHQNFSSRNMKRSENACSCIRAFFHIFNKNRISLFCKFRICITCFLWERISIQPVQQFQIHAGRTEGILRSMKMQVCQTWNNKLIAEICTFNFCILLREFFKYPDTASIFTDQIALLSNRELCLGTAVADCSFKCKCLFVVHNHYLLSL